MAKLQLFNDGYIYITEKGSTTSTTLQRENPHTVYDGSEAVKQMWLILFNELELHQQKLIQAVCPEVFLMLDEGKSAKEPSRVYKIAMSRLAKSPFAKTCSRCGGSGHHSFNLKDGTVCYGCGGYKKVLPKLTDDLLKSIADFYKQNQS